MLRDIMGMNRYKSVSSQLSESGRNQLIDYQNANADNYESIDSQDTHGFTYYAMKRLGWASNADNVNKNNKMPYRYMINNPEGNAVCTKNDTTRKTGFNNNNDLTTVASKLNEGQITEYPYKIDDSLTIAATHGQWFQLNMEDKDVTVWYTLADNVNVGSVNEGAARGWNATDNNGPGTALTYGVSPNDAANNYYIYSKGNVFYSGVGHSTVTGDMEAKLFVNTMIAAYRASYEPPVVEITNDEAILSGMQSYTVEIMQEFDNDLTASGSVNEQTAEVFDAGEYYEIKFQPVDFNLVSTTLECSIWYEADDGTRIDITQITRNGVTIDADPATHKFTGLQNGAEYIIQYPKSYLSDTNPKRKVKFEIKNNRSTSTSITALNLRAQPLFQLD
jgi:hypothetical protein